MVDYGFRTPQDDYEAAVERQRSDSRSRLERIGDVREQRRRDRLANQQTRASDSRMNQMMQAQNQILQNFQQQYIQAGQMWQNALMGDMQKAEGALGQRKANQQSGLSLRAGALGQFGQRGTQALGGADQRQAAGTQKTKQMEESRAALASSSQVDEIVNAVLRGGEEQIQAAKDQTSDYIKQLYAMKGDEMASFANETANAISAQRSAIDAQQKQTEQQITQQMAQMGFAANSPAVRNAVIRSRQVASNQLADIGSQVAVAYNDKRAELLSSAHNRIASFLPQAVSAVQGAMEGAATRELGARTGAEQLNLQRQSQVAANDQEVWSTLAQLNSQYNLSRTTMELAQNQAELAGLTDLSDYIANLDTNYVSWSPAMSQVMNLFIDEAMMNASLQQQMTQLYT